MGKIKTMLRQIVLGMIEGIFYSIVYIYLLPYLYKSFAYSFSSFTSVPTLTSFIPTSEVLTYIGLFIGLEVSAKVLKGTIYNPILKASSSLLGLLIVLIYFGGGVLKVGPIFLKNMGDAYITLNLSLILLIYVAFIAAPGIIIPFIEYFVEDKG
ncbi:MAG: hypothetical protein G5Z42_03755 [Caldisphaeraceae archaeon]|nr:hypothetical protein [Caldisphaeraceae archaeon]MEB3692138.1 hypothetical protein [Caldisphaeraceae archaeon]MEB3797921.1 hypothetical protein [Caldisphaeraceae archaeon]